MKITPALVIATTISASLLGFFASPASAAQSCCKINTNPGVTPVIQRYESFDDDMACYKGIGCDPNVSGAVANCSAHCDCSQPAESCKSTPPPGSIGANGTPWKCTLQMTDGSFRSDCVTDRSFCADNASDFQAKGIAACACADSPECATVATGSNTPAPLKPLINPLGTSDVRDLVARFIRIITGVSGSLALLMFVYGGFLWTTSGGNSEQVKKGQKVFVNASIGLIIIFTAYVAISALFKVFSGASL